ncbi:MAG: hypothetical protein ACRERU_20965 [Methylococcales bacterium]
MHIQKSSAFSTVASVLHRNGTPGVDRESNRKLPDTSDHARNDNNDGPPPVAEIDLRLVQAEHDRVKIHSIDGRTLFELNPKLDRRTQTAIDSYETAQAQSDAQQRELVSKLLGIDLYV